MNARAALYRQYERAGFTLVRSKRHAIWQCPCGHTRIASPTSPGKGRAATNCLSDITRALRGCTQQRRTA